MKILLVDDERPCLNILQRAVQKHSPDAEIKGYDEPLEAIHIVENKVFIPDVAFLDIEMPSMGGVELAKKLKAHNPLINIIFSTGYSDYMLEAFTLYASDYLLKPVSEDDVAKALDNLRHPVSHVQQKGIYAVTFGNFGFFKDGKPVYFSRYKSKELLAYLIDRRGVAVSRKELASVLFEDSNFSRAEQNRLSIIIHDLKKDLQASGTDSVLIKKRADYAIDLSQISVDSHRYLQGDPTAINLYKGEYMEQYEWGEYFKSKFSTHEDE